MIVFDESTWTISLPPGESPVARQYDNLTRSIVVTGVPDGWDWTLLVQASGKLDIIDLEPVEGGVGVTLTAQMLALSGFYSLQLRGTQGELVRHTNVAQAIIPASLSGDATWPTVPSAVEQALQQLEELNQHPPYPGDNGYWMVWDLDSGAYVQSQLPLPPVAEGPAGKAATIEVGTVTTGDPGTQAQVTNAGTENAAILDFTIPRGAVGPTGATPDISVQVSGLPADSEPTVSVSGTPEAPVIALGIPAGKDGEPGTPGTPGTDGQTPNITTGTVETLPAGSDATASITGQTPNLTLNLGIPQGPEGDPGAAATIIIGETVTGAPGTQASVENVGTPNAAILNFTIPQGENGAGGGAPLTLLCDVTLSEDSAQVVQDFDKPYKYLEGFFYAPKMDQNTTNNNNVYFWPNGMKGYQFTVGQLSIYGPVSARRTIICTPFCFYVNYTTKPYEGFSDGISSFTLVLNTSDENNLFRSGYRYIVYGREEI